MRRPRLALLAAVIALAPRPARAMSPEDGALVERGMDALFRCDYDGAESLFLDARRERPGDPVLSLGVATVRWWRLENAFAAPGGPLEKPFLEAVKAAIDDAKRARRADGVDEAEADLYLGAAYGLRGRWEAAQRHWFAAYFDGRRSYKAERRAVTLDPELYDAYLGLGAFDYYVATLGRFVRALSFTSGGDKRLGLDELGLAAEKGRFGSTPAKLLLAGIDWTFEKDAKGAWALVEDLSRRYPDSPLILSMRLLGLFHLRDAEGLKREARAFLAKADAKAPFYTPLDAAAGRYFLGLGLQLGGEDEAAIAEYEKALSLVPPSHRWRSMLRLFIGECLDDLGRRDAAVASYKRALADPPLWGVPRYAKFLLKRPFRRGDNPLPARNDSLD